jgi:hypothetical protein
MKWAKTKENKFKQLTYDRIRLADSFNKLEWKDFRDYNFRNPTYLFNQRRK